MYFLFQLLILSKQFPLIKGETERITDSIQCFKAGDKLGVLCRSENMWVNLVLLGLEIDQRSY